jgi:hypothetical protein
MKAKLHSYTGDGTEAWLEFAMHARVVATANRWDAETLKVMIMAALKGQALRHLTTLPDPSRYDLVYLLDALREEFDRPEARMALIAELNARRQGAKESLLAVANDIRRLVRKAYPSYDPSAQQDVMCIRFREAIRSSHVKFAVMRMQGLTTLHELVAEAELVSRAGSASYGEKQFGTAATTQVNLVSEASGAIASLSLGRNPASVGESGGLQASMTRLVAQVGELEFRQRAALEQRTCFRCHKQGHISYDCPDRDKSKGYQPRDWKPKEKGKGKPPNPSSSDKGGNKTQADGKKEEKPKPSPSQADAKKPDPAQAGNEK